MKFMLHTYYYVVIALFNHSFIITLLSLILCRVDTTSGAWKKNFGQHFNTLCSINFELSWAQLTCLVPTSYGWHNCHTLLRYVITNGVHSDRYGATTNSHIMSHYTDKSQQSHSPLPASANSSYSCKTSHWITYQIVRGNNHRFIILEC